MSQPEALYKLVERWTARSEDSESYPHNSGLKIAALELEAALQAWDEQFNGYEIAGCADKAKLLILRGDRSFVTASELDVFASAVRQALLGLPAKEG